MMVVVIVGRIHVTSATAPVIHLHHLLHVHHLLNAGNQILAATGVATMFTSNGHPTLKVIMFVISNISITGIQVVSVLDEVRSIPLVMTAQQYRLVVFVPVEKLKLKHNI
ncbi:hypothetical protein HY386_02015 [Candidatus Daviesbacteria bacterium]|nr:hypothetical protein [Candidatus Daviesbacteria bacterium]